MFIIEYVRARQSEQNENLRYVVSYFSSLSFTAFCRLSYIISRDNDSDNSGYSTGNLTQDFLVQIQIRELTDTKQ